MYMYNYILTCMLHSYDYCVYIIIKYGMGFNWKCDFIAYGCYQNVVFMVALLFQYQSKEIISG